MTTDIRQPVQKLRLSKADKSTIGCLAFKQRQKKIVALTTEAMAHHVTSSLLNQSLLVPSSSTYSSVPKKTAIDNRPAQSKSSSSEGSGSSKSTKVHVTAVTTMPGTRLTRNNQCHENNSVR